jgi:glutamyl-tRNA synthetase
VEAYRERAVTLRELAASVRYLYEQDVVLNPDSAKKNLRPVIGEALGSLRDAWAQVESWSAAEIHQAMEEVCSSHELKFGKLGQPVRVAVTGGPVSPPIDITVELVGKQRTLARLDQALNFISERAATQ